MSDFDFDILQELEAAAPAAGYANVNYGKLTVTVNRKRFEGSKKNGNLKVVTEKYDGKPLKEGERLNFVFNVDIKEFNSKLDFEYERNVDMVHSRGKNLTDWSEIVFPSIKAVFGDQWAKAIMKKPYVLIEDVPQVNDKPTAEKHYSTIKFLKAFKNKAECEADRAARFASSDDAVDNSDGEIPADVINDVKGLINAVGGKDEAAKMMTENNLFPNYDHAALLEAATA